MPTQARVGGGEAKVHIQRIRNPGLEGGGWAAPHSGLFIPIVQEAEWASLDGMENLSPTEIRSPDHSSRSYPLYRLRYASRPSVQ